MATVTAQQTHALIGLYLKEYSSKYGKTPLNFNRNREKWGFQSMIEDLGIDRSKEVIKYYFETGKMGHPVSHLLSNYDKINIRMLEREEDAANRERLRAETKKRVEEWRASVKQ